MTNDTHQYRPLGLDDHSGLPVRPVPASDGRASDEAATDEADSADRTDPARVLRVRGIRARFSRAGGRVYAYVDVRGRAYAIGGFADAGTARHVAEQAVIALAEVMPETPDEILEAFVCEVEASVPVDVRRSVFGFVHDPIARAVSRIGVVPTRQQLGRLYGVSRSLIEIVEKEAIAKIREGLDAHR